MNFRCKRATFISSTAMSACGLPRVSRPARKTALKGCWTLLIDSKCESFRAEYRQGKLKQPAYDSLEWILSPIITTTLSDSIGTSLVLVVGDMPQTGKGFSAVLKELNTNTSYFVKSYVLTRASVTEMKSPSPCLKANTRSLKTPSGGFSPCVR